MPLGTNSGFPCLLYERDHTASDSSYPFYKRSTVGLTSVGKQAHRPGLSVWTIEEETGGWGAGDTEAGVTSPEQHRQAMQPASAASTGHWHPQMSLTAALSPHVTL